MKFKKGNVLILIPSLIAVVALAVAGYFFYQNKNLQKPKIESAVKDETANWKTYTNDKYGFSVKYPSQWYAGIVNTPDSPVVQVAIQPAPIVAPETHGSPDRMKFGIATQNYLESPKKTNIEIDGISAQKIDASNSPSEGLLYFSEVTLIKNGMVYLISWPDIDSGGKYKPIFDQILGTFRFLE